MLPWWQKRAAGETATLGTRTTDLAACRKKGKGLTHIDEQGTITKHGKLLDTQFMGCPGQTGIHPV